VTTNQVQYDSGVSGGTFTGTYTISDGKGGTDSAPLTVTVIGPQQPSC
jgi:hypothetical protein